VSGAIDLQAFRALQESAGAEFVADLVVTFLEEAPRMQAELAAALAARSVDRFRRAAHSLKSNSLTFGATALGAMARELELGAASVVERGDAAPLAALESEYARAATALTELRNA
jgi:HPt (histidine-containing phosphotransfer) domain-containing protein